MDFSFNSETICDLILVTDLNEKSVFLALEKWSSDDFPEKAGLFYDSLKQSAIENGLVYVLTEIDRLILRREWVRAPRHLQQQIKVALALLVI